LDAQQQHQNTEAFGRLFGPLLSNNHEQVIYTHGAQANSAIHPFGLGK